MAKKPRKRFETEEGNLDMIKNSVRAIKHHADELTSELKKNPEIEAWVLAKVDRAAQNLSDVTHYLDGEMNKFAKGGKTPVIRTQFEEEEFEYGKGGQIAYDLVPMIPYGVKGMITPDYKKTWFLMGTEDEAFAKAKEMANSNPNFVRVEIKRKLKTKTNTVGIVDGQNKQYAKGGKVELIFHGSSREIPMGEFESASAAKKYVQESDWKRPYSIKKIGSKKMAQGGRLLTDYSKISSVEVDGIDTNDAPDFVDAYITYAEYDGEPMTDEQLEELNNDGDFVYSAVERHLYAKGGKVKRKRWIQDALSGDHKGALRETAKRKGLLKGDEKLSKSDLHKLEKMGGKTARRAHLAETLRDFKK
jgi:hypothetical protein